ncbi:MADS-box transcription factor [Parasponia andersonii]|uniref:MADS-box transcription factor n=1 Tax=Parasponia andersonii TaxID=3476 RepID=A0A2P5AJN8_PARAD|nr:MADS-box transcription factor [Parasponia andersonii]
MGRLKLKIKRLESTSNRQVTYSKRRNGILKKAKELSILCDIDIVLLMFSPTGKPTLYQGERSNFDEVITKFSQLTPQERTKRKLESLEALKKTFKKLDHEVNIQDFLGSSSQTVEFQCEMSLPLMVGGVQEAQPLPWIPNNENQPLMLPNEPNFLPHGEVQCAAEASLSGCSSYFTNGSGKQMEVDDPGQLSNIEQGGCSLDELSRSAGLSLDFGEQYSYPCLPNDKNLKPNMEMNLQATPVDYQVNNNCELPTSLYDNPQHAWVSGFGPCGLALYNENACQQQLK